MLLPVHIWTRSGSNNVLACAKPSGSDVKGTKAALGQPQEPSLLVEEHTVKGSSACSAKKSGIFGFRVRSRDQAKSTLNGKSPLRFGANSFGFSRFFVGDGSFPIRTSEAHESYGARVSLRRRPTVCRRTRQGHHGSLGMTGRTSLSGPTTVEMGDSRSG